MTRAAIAKKLLGTRADKIRYEDHLQVYAADTLRAYAVPGVIWYHVPNQGIHQVQYRAKLKSFGLRPGVADLAFTLLDGRSAYLELKRHDGKRSPAQIEFGEDCERIGVPYAYAKTCDEVDAFLITHGIINKPAVTQPAERSDASCSTGAVVVATISRSRATTSKRRRRAA